MPVIAGIIWGGLLNILGTIVGRIFLAIGMGVVVYTGFGSALDQINSFGRGALMGLPPELKQILGLLRIGEVFSMYSSTVLIKMMYQYGLNNGSIKRMGYK